MRPELQGVATSGRDEFDVDIRGLKVVETEGGSYLVAVTGVNGGLVSYDISGSGLAFTDSRLHQDATLLTGDVSDLATELDGFALGDTADSTLQRYVVDEDGDISALDTTALPGADTGLRAVSHVDLGDAGSAFFAITSESTLSGWRFGDSDATPVSIPDMPDVAHGSGALLQTAPMSGAQVLLVADGNPGGITSYVVDPGSGALRPGDSFAQSDGLSVATPTEFISFQAHGATWAVLGSAGSNSLSLFSVSEGGDLRFFDQVADTAHTRFQGATAVDDIAIADHHFIVAAGQDDGFSILRVLPDGKLVHQTTIVHEVGSGLQNISAIELTLEGDQLHIFASSQVTGGITQFTVPVSDLGDSETATSASLGGTNAGDLLMSGDEATALSGGRGDDVLVASNDGDRLTGGLGQDRFVVQDIDGDIRILDFVSGQDRLDLSLFASLRNSGQLGVTATSSGAILTYQDTLIRLSSASGDSLDLADIFWDGFHALDRIGLGDTSSDGVIYGGADADQLTGTDGADEIQGQSGNDSLNGQAGDDVLSGGDGADVLNGGAGADTVFGGFAEDVLNGGLGADRLYGEQGNDRVYGGDGDDQLWGADGNDSLVGGTGSDQVSGGSGHDDLRGNAGQDVLSGNSGADLLRGNGGNDTLYGNEGVDTLKGGLGDDVLYGGSGNDKLKGKVGSDRLHGGSGDDKLKGGDGNDSLFGGDGNDRLDGGRGDDVYQGDAGADRFMFKRYHGVDRIVDFTQGEDVIDLRYLGQGGIKRVANLDMSQQDADVLINTGLGEIWLTNTALSDMDGADFLI